MQILTLVFWRPVHKNNTKCLHNAQLVCGSHLNEKKKKKMNVIILANKLPKDTSGNCYKN